MGWRHGSRIEYMPSKHKFKLNTAKKKRKKEVKKSAMVGTAWITLY
jgi:hypothetical protein